MKILELYAEEFGKLHDRRFAPGDGLTLFEGPNESGKSTLLALIRFLFYGFTQRSTEEKTERDKRLAWRTGMAAGQVRFVDDGCEYLLSRRFTGGRDEMSLTRAPGGEAVDTGDITPGEYFFGLPVQLFDNSMCVRQSAIETIGDKEVRAGVGTALFSGDGDSSIKSAINDLDKVRVKLKKLRGWGGAIDESEQACIDAETRLFAAKAAAEQRAGYEEQARRAAEEVARYTHELQATEAALGAAQADEQLQRFDAWHDAKARAQAAKAALEEAEKKIAAARLPDEEFFKQTESLLAEYERADAAPAQAGQETVNTPQNAEKQPALAWIEREGGPEIVAGNYARLTGKCKTYCLLAVACFALAAVAAALAVAITPLLWIVAGLSAAGGALLLFLFLSARKRVKEIRQQTGLPDGANMEMYLMRLTSAAAAQVSQALENAQKQRLTELENKIVAAFDAAGQPKPANVKDAATQLERLQQTVRQADEKLKQLRDEWGTADAAARALESTLPPVDEASLRARRAELPAVTESIEVLTQRRAELQQNKDEADRRREEAARQSASIHAVDPDECARQLAEAQAKLAKAKADHAAVGMAMEALKEADDELHNLVLPQVRTVASKLFADLTNGAYDCLIVNDEFAVQLDTPNGPKSIELFSAGCRDAAYLALRLSLLDQLSKGKKLPLLFDEALSRLDDRRAAALLQVLCRYAEEGGQVLLFTCHTRERHMLAGAPNLVCLSLAE